MTVDVTITQDVEPGDNWLRSALATLRARWWLVLGAVLLCLIAAIVYLRGATYLYTAELRVYAAPSSGSQPQLPSSVSGLASLAGISSPGAESASPFRLYLEGVRAREVAERLARDRSLMREAFAGEYDARTGGWRERRGFAASLKRSLWDLLGLRSRAWHPPDAARLQDFIAGSVVVNQSPKSPLVSISLDHPDPKFAVRFLTKLGVTVDAYLRERQQARTRSYIEYLSEKLRGVTFIEQRAALFAALNDQERQAMLANSRAPYAANMFGVATATSEPTRPKQMPILLAGILGGLVLGVAAALLLGPPRRRAVSILDDGVA